MIIFLWSVFGFLFWLSGFMLIKNVEEIKYKFFYYLISGPIVFVPVLSSKLIKRFFTNKENLWDLIN
ncbi:MAG: hypothetical protein ACOC56_00300 [Atribacterota bacterium]